MRTPSRAASSANGKGKRKGPDVPEEMGAPSRETSKRRATAATQEQPLRSLPERNGAAHSPPPENNDSEQQALRSDGAANSEVIRRLSSTQAGGVGRLSSASISRVDSSMSRVSSSASRQRRAPASSPARSAPLKAAPRVPSPELPAMAHQPKRTASMASMRTSSVSSMRTGSAASEMGRGRQVQRGAGGVGGSSKVPCDGSPGGVQDAPSRSTLSQELGDDDIQEEDWEEDEVEVWVPCGVLLLLCLAIVHQLSSGVAVQLVSGMIVAVTAGVVVLALTEREARETWWARTLFSELPVGLPVTIVLSTALLIIVTAAPELSRTRRHPIVTISPASLGPPHAPSRPKRGLLNLLKNLRKAVTTRDAHLHAPVTAASSVTLGGDDRRQDDEVTLRQLLWAAVWCAITLGLPYIASRSPVCLVFHSLFCSRLLLLFLIFSLSLSLPLSLSPFLSSPFLSLSSPLFLSPSLSKTNQ